MIEVALETSTRVGSVALRAGGETIEVELEGEQSHASDALVVLERIMREVRVDPAEIDAVYVGTGPGSYTGLRIGIATAFGLARGARAALRGEPSGETIAWRELAPGETCVHLLDARQSELYFAHYRREEEDVEILSPPQVVRPDRLKTSMPLDCAVFGDLEALRVAGLEDLAATRLRSGTVPRAGALLELAGRRLGSAGAQRFDEVAPLYLRPFAARVRKR